MSSGALTPGAAVEAIYHDALHHLDEPIILCFVKNIAGGLQLSLAGLTSLLVAGGIPGIHKDNPGISYLLEGSIFATGLIMVYFTGGELVTGYPMWLAIAALQRKRRWPQYVKSAVTSLFGNLVGALIAAFLFIYVGGDLNKEPWRSFVVHQVDSNISSSSWHAIFVKAIGCGYLVTLAMLLGTQNMDGISKAMALWLPFALASIAQFPHTVKYMYFGPVGILLGADITVGQFIGRGMAPIILGNVVGGALFTGVYHWWVFLHHGDGEKKAERTFRERIVDFDQEDED